MRFDIEEYVLSNLVRPKPVESKNGQEMTAVCPACEKYGGFYVNKESGAYLCNKCSFRARTVVGLVAQVEGISWSEARAYIFEKSVKLRRKSDVFSLVDRVRALRPEAVKDEDEERENVDVELPEYFVPIFDPKRKPNWKIPHYLKERRIKSYTVKDWGLGYCRKGKYSDRLIIPIDCPNGVSWTARAMSDDVWGPKYLNPPGADHSRLLIGWNVSRITGDLVLCEGPLDAVKLYQNDISALALGGKELHDEQLGLLMTLNKSSAITIMLDPEEDIAPYNIAARLSVHFDYIYIAKLPKIKIDGKMVDPGSAPRKMSHMAIDKAEKWTGSRSHRLKAIISRSKEKLR